MTNLVEIKNNETLVPLKSIIEYSGNKYETVRDIITKNKYKFIQLGLSKAKDMTDFKSAVFEDNLSLNEEQTSFLFVLMSNNDRIIEFKFNLVKQFYEMKSSLINQGNRLLIEKDKTIRQLQEHVYAKPRGFGFENVFRIIKDYELDISTSDFNKILSSEGIIREESYLATRYIPNGTTSLENDGSVVVHVDTALGILQKHNIKSIPQNQLRFDL